MTSLYSARWHRVAPLAPRLAARVRLRRQRLRGEVWYLLADPASGRSVRLNGAAYALVGRFDGARTMQQLWDAQLAREHEPPTQDEAIEVLVRLRESALIEFSQAPDFSMLLPHLERVAPRRSGGNLLAWRLPLADPSRWLDRLQPLQRALFSRPALAAWAVAMLALLVLGVQHAPTLWAHAQLWMTTPRFTLLALLLYVPIKLIHETAHGMAVRRWGGQVHEAGVTLMLLMPVPYVDASAATSFVQRRHRMAVAAAGIMAELAMAFVALSLWLALGDGWVRDAAFVTFFICSVSTLLFNANPLQRLDGYYIATDALELPNLAPRSRAWWLDLLVRRLLRTPGAEAMPVAAGEAPWLAAYAPLAWAWSIGVGALAVAWLGQASFAVGAAAGGLLAWQIVVRPVLRVAGQLRRVALAQSGTAQRWRRVVLGGAALLAAAALLPMPQHTLVQGVVWPSDDAQLRANEDGFIESVAVRDGERVQAGQRVLQLANPKLAADLARQAARVTSIETELFQALPAGNAAVGDARAGLVAAQAELGRLEERVEALTVRATTAGRLALPGGADLPGGFVRHGALLGHTLTDAALTVRVAVPEAEATGLRANGRGVSVRLAGAPAVAHAASLLQDSIGAAKKLPSAALSARHGGDVQTDPRDAADLTPLRPVVLLDVRLSEGVGEGAGADAAARERIGQRAWVRFDGGFAPPVVQAARALARQVRERFNPQF